MDAEQQRDALARLESDYVRGALSAEEYARLKGPLLVDGATSAAPAISVQESGSSAPTPADADPVTGIRLARWGRRAGAWLIDLVVLVFVWGIAFAWAFTTEDELTGEISDAAAIVIVLVAFFGAPIYQWLMIGRWGQTLGKMALGIKVVRSEDAGRVSYARALARAASVALLGIFSLPLLLAYLWPLWDTRNQALYDKMASTLVTKLG